MFRFLLVFLLIFSFNNVNLLDSNAEEGSFEESGLGSVDSGLLVLTLSQEVNKIHDVKLQNVDLKQDVDHMMHAKKCECEKDSKDCKCPDEAQPDKMAQDAKGNKASW